MLAGAASSTELEVTVRSLSHGWLSWAPEDGSHGQLSCLHLLVALIREVDQPGHVEEQFG